MTELRDKVAKEIRDALIGGYPERSNFPELLANLILTVPEIAVALALRECPDCIRCGSCEQLRQDAQ